MSEEIQNETQAEEAAAPVVAATPAAPEAPAATPKSRGSRKARRGEVISRSGDKSIVVRAERRRIHPMYGKVVREFKKYHVHDEKNIAKLGDIVEIAECRPISKMKCWRLVSVISTTGA